MMPSEHHRAVRTLLDELEREMRTRGLWSAAPPSPAALASVMPFMYDTLRLHQWLQWVFLPRTRAVIDASGTLPGNCHIHPLAEHEFIRLAEVDTKRLLSLIAQLDDCMNAGSATH